MEKQRKSTFAFILQCMFSLLIITFAILNAPSFVNVSANSGKPVDTTVKNVQHATPLYQQSILSRQELTYLEGENIAQKYMQACLGNNMM